MIDAARVFAYPAPRVEQTTKRIVDSGTIQARTTREDLGGAEAGPQTLYATTI